MFEWIGDCAIHLSRKTLYGAGKIIYNLISFIIE